MPGPSRLPSLGRRSASHLRSGRGESNSARSVVSTAHVTGFGALRRQGRPLTTEISKCSWISPSSLSSSCVPISSVRSEDGAENLVGGRAPSTLRAAGSSNALQAYIAARNPRAPEPHECPDELACHLVLPHVGDRGRPIVLPADWAAPAAESAPKPASQSGAAAPDAMRTTARDVVPLTGATQKREKAG